MISVFAGQEMESQPSGATERKVIMLLRSSEGTEGAIRPAAINAVLCCSRRSSYRPAPANRATEQTGASWGPSCNGYVRGALAPEDGIPLPVFPRIALPGQDGDRRGAFVPANKGMHLTRSAPATQTAALAGDPQC